MEARYIQFHLIQWQTIKGESTVMEELLGRQDGRLHAKLSRVLRLCCKRKTYEETKPIRLSGVYCSLQWICETLTAISMMSARSAIQLKWLSVFIEVSILSNVQHDAFAPLSIEFASPNSKCFNTFSDCRPKALNALTKEMVSLASVIYQKDQSDHKCIHVHNFVDCMQTQYSSRCCASLSVLQSLSSLT